MELTRKYAKKCFVCPNTFIGTWNAKYCDPCNVQRKTKSLGDKKLAA